MKRSFRYAYLLFDKECKGLISREEVMAVVAENGQKDVGSMSILSQVTTTRVCYGGPILLLDGVRDWLLQLQLHDAWLHLRFLRCGELSPTTGAMGRDGLGH